MTTAAEIGEWFDRGVRQGAEYMIVVCDTFDHEGYPSYVQPGEDFWAKYESYDGGKGMQRIMEVYNLRKSKPEQMGQRRAFAVPPRPAA